MILSFNKFTNGVVSITYDFEQEDFNYESFPQAYSLKLTAKTQFWISMVTFIIETLKHFMRIQIRHSNLLESGIYQVIKDLNYMELLLKPDTYDETSKKDNGIIYRLVTPDQNEKHTQGKLFVF